jgi:hypothetical protein
LPAGVSGVTSSPLNMQARNGVSTTPTSRPRREIVRAGRNARFDGARRAREREVVTGKVLLRWICEGHEHREPDDRDRMALVELLQKSGESDFMRAVAVSVIIAPGGRRYVDHRPA